MKKPKVKKPTLKQVLKAVVAIAVILLLAFGAIKLYQYAKAEFRQIVVEVMKEGCQKKETPRRRSKRRSKK